MSIINKKNALAIALVAGLGLAGSAAAFTTTTNGDTDPVLVATADIISAATDIGVNEALVVALTSNDNILGRTTGFTIKFSLNSGATFGRALVDTDLTVGPAGGSLFDPDGAGPLLPGSQAWTASIAAGGGLTDGFVTVRFEPNASPFALGTGDLLTIVGADAVVAPTTGLILDDLTVLQTAGNTVSTAVQFIDPTTAAFIMAAGSTPLLTSGDPIVLGCDTTGGDSVKRIDVGVTAQASKTYFSSTGDIGGADSGFINIGTVGASRATGFTSFSYVGTDEFVTVLTGDFSAFTPNGADRHVFLASDAACSLQLGADGVINNVNGTVTLTYDGTDVGIIATGFDAFVCAEVPAGNTTVIDATTVSATTTFTRGDVTGSDANCPLVPLRYNGSVVEVYHLNPAGNTTAQSFMRVINPSDTDGTVTIVGTDDNGVDGDSAITFNLGARKSMQLNSDDLENGNAGKGLTGSFGDGAGKWRAVVTGEFANMKVQSLNRNATDGTVTNLTDADGAGEQNLNNLFETGGGFGP